MGPALATSAGAEAALRRIEPLDNGGSRLLYLYERGAILRDAGDLRASNQAFELAEALFEDLYTKKLTREVGSLITGDYLREYRGERFEATLVNYYKMMNYLRLGEEEEAVVECRKLNHKLQLFQDQGKSFYSNDPFLQYLTGMVYALAGERVDADVSMRVALDSYRSLQGTYGVEMPASLLCDLAENARALGNLADAERYRSEGGCVVSHAERMRPGSLRLLLECGRVPFKVERSIVLPIFKDEIHDDTDQDAFARELALRRDRPLERRRKLEYLLKVAMPAMAGAPGVVEYARVHALPVADSAATAIQDEAGVLQATTILAANLRVLALKSFEERQGEILTRAVARSLAKYMAQRGAKDKKGRVAGLLVNLAGVATEAADLRSWSALPEKILMSNLELPPGRYRVEVELFGASRRRVGFVALPEVQVRSGRPVLLSRRIY